jgi:hypothetical protein
LQGRGPQRYSSPEEDAVTRIRSVPLLAALAAGCLAATPAVATSIAAIVDAPESYVNQQVTVIGTVTAQTIGYRGESVYTLSGDDRRITVFSRGAAPAPGERLEVTAKVGWRAPDEEFTWPPVLLERGRQAAP